MQKSNRILVGVLIVALVIAAAGLALYFGPTAREARSSDAAEAVLLSFGSTLKNVSLLADKDALNASIDENYAPYVTPELLADWKANPAHVPGRLTSSPWPDRLGVGSTVVQGSSRIITGEVILVSSAEGSSESTDTVPFVAQLIPTESGWKIAAYQEEKVQTLKNIPKTDEDIPGAK